MLERLIAVNLLFCFILPMMVPTRECLFADKSEKDKSRTSSSGDSAAMIAASMFFLCILVGLEILVLIGLFVGRVPI